MIILEKCDIVVSRMHKMATGETQVEGKALVLGPFEDGINTVKPSTGAADEVFVGVMYGEYAGNAVATSHPYNEQFTVPAEAPYTITLPYEPIAGDLRVYNETDGAEIGEGIDAAGNYQIDGKTITFNAAQAGDTVTIALNYAPSASEVQARYGSGYPGGSASNAQGLTGVAESGTMVTDQFEVTDDWSDPRVVRLGADGRFTTSGTGTIVPGAVVKKIPSAGDPWLALRFAA